MNESGKRLTLIKSMSRQCIAARVRLLSRIVTNIYDSAMKPFGVKLNQMSILVTVYVAGEIGYDTLCKRLRMEKSTASRNIERLKRNGWLQTVALKEERRKLLKVTPAGEKLLEKVHGAWENAQKKAVKLLGDKETEALCNIANGMWKKDKTE